MSNRPQQPSRRTLLVAGATLLAGAGFFAARLFRSGAGSRARDADRLLAFFAEPERIRALGESYLKAHPEEADRERLISLLLDEIGEVSDLDSDEQLRERVGAAVHDDFAAERTVRVEGWIVSRTEARLTALVAMRPAGHA